MTDRPLSPHLQIYRPQITSVLSILHRITGFGLAVGCLLVPLWLWAALAGDEAFAQLHAFKNSWVGQAMLFGWLFAFIYHLLNGLRHLAWDVLLGLEINTARRTGWLVVALTVALTLLIWGWA